MAKKDFACAITMVRDDYFFLEKWIAYYSRFFGREVLYIVNHGGGEEVARIAEGCNVINIPDEFSENFDAKRWRFLSNFANALRSYFDWVIVGDVDEFVVVDPKTGLTLDQFLAKRRGNMTLTPIGLEVIQQEDEEDGIEDSMLGPRRFARFTTAYSKPCLSNHGVKISRGGHYTEAEDLRLFGSLYLFHMRYVDKQMFFDTMARRAQQIQKLNDPANTLISRMWVSSEKARQEAEQVFALPVTGEFDFSAETKAMEESWHLRNEYGLYAFDRQINTFLCEIPKRFFGIV